MNGLHNRAAQQVNTTLAPQGKQPPLRLCGGAAAEAVELGEAEYLARSWSPCLDPTNPAAFHTRREHTPAPHQLS